MYADLKPDEVFDTLYFRDFQSLQDQIEATLSLAAKVDDNVFATQIAAIYMAWCGLSAEEALSIRKADVLEDRVICGDKILHPNRTIMRFLQDYRDAEGYYSQARAVIYLKYMPSEYLFRTARDAHIEDTKALRIFIRNFGKCSGEGNLFHYDKVFTSGTFHRTYLHELANGNIEVGDLNTLRSVFKEPFQSISQANKRLHEYKKYRDYFFPYQDK